MRLIVHAFNAIFLITSILQAGSLTDRKPITLSLMTFNVRYDAKSDHGTKMDWSKRLPRIKSMLRKNKSDIIGLQEPYGNQIRDMQAALGDQYSWIGLPRGQICEGVTKQICIARQKACDLHPNTYICDGEYAAIFYDTKRLKLIKTDTFWLNPQKKKYERGWNAANLRICTWALFEDKIAGTQFYIFNAHVDRQEPAKQEQINLVLAEAQRIAGEHIFFVMGDFNTKSQKKKAKIFANYKMDDSRSIAQRTSGPQETFFKGKATQQLDHILAPQALVKNGTLTILDADTIVSPPDQPLSDHVPYRVKVEVK